MVDDAGWTSFEALHRLAAVATRSGGYLTSARIVGEKAPRSHQRQMVDDAGWTSFEALHRLAAVATRNGGYEKKRYKKEARDRPKKRGQDVGPGL